MISQILPPVAEEAVETILFSHFLLPPYDCTVLAKGVGDSASLQRALGLSSQGGSLHSAFSVAPPGPHRCLVGFAYDGHWLLVSGCSLPGVSDFPCP